MRPRDRVLAAVALAALSTIARPASAQCPVGAFTCYFGTDLGGSSTARPPATPSSTAARNTFFTRLTGAGTETFEGLVAGTTTPYTITFPGAGTATLSGGGQVVSNAGVAGGRYPTSGSKYHAATSAAGGGATFTIDFSNPVAAFGFFASDVGDFVSQLSLRFTLSGGGTATWGLPYVASNGANSARDGSLLYAGFIAEVGSFTRVQFLGTDSDDIFAFDDMTIGSVQQIVPPISTVPEPASMTLVATGLALIVGVSRRRRNRSLT